MSADEEKQHAPKPPKPIIKKMHWPYPIIWLLPILAAFGAWHYFHDYLRDRGNLITIKFDDASGLKDGETKVMFRGVEVGQVSSVDLSDDLKQALVQVRLREPQTNFAKKGAKFWVVRPEFSAGSFTGLNTVLSGPYIDSLPGSGALASEFDGLTKAPLTQGKGIHVVLRTDHVEHLQPDSSVFYKGIEVGTIDSIRLDPTGSSVEVRCFIRERYSPLVKSNSQFWIVSGVDVKGGIFTGLEFKVESLRSLLSGGVAFATPDENWGEASVNGSEFRLKEEVRPEWVKWSPQIPLGPEESSDGARKEQLPNGEDALHSAMNK